ncbi:MAG: VOC family protein [Acidobacteria bacterium]|nr:VOC family protein [Acidobacteriota bacterium]
MQSITPHLWFDKEARPAAELYTSIIPNSGITSVKTLRNTPSGDVDILSFALAGQSFMAISAGPQFKLNPAISFLIGCDSKAEVDRIWNPLAEGGTALMPLGAYPFSERFGWVQDRYGLSWQVMDMGGWKSRQRIIPSLLFVGKVCGKAEEAIGFYTSIFPNSAVDTIHRYAAGEGPEVEGTVKHAGFALNGLEFAAMDSARAHNFAFNEAVSFMVSCETQEEIDYFWEKLSAVPQAEACGWLKDRYGVSWQIVPTAMQEMMQSGDAQKMARVTAAFLKMKKFDIAVLRKAFEGV